MNFREAAIRSSELYYDFLRMNKGSLIKYSVEHISKYDPYYRLYTNAPLTDVEMMQIKISSNIFSREEYQIVEISRKEKYLKIIPDRNLSKYLDSCEISEIELIIDLKFLIKNVGSFYQKYGNRISFPTSTNNIPYVEDNKLEDKPSKEQAKAVEGVLASPISYVWGAPGTGKTRFVLARCVLSYLKADKDAKILIVAPTNNAVEQTLWGILPVLQQSGINIRSVFRMGSPTNEFYDKYSVCCEVSEAEKLVKSLDDKIHNIDDEICKTQKSINLFREYQKALKFEKQLEECSKIVPTYFSKMNTEKAKLLAYNREVISNKGKITYTKSTLSTLESNKNSCILEISKFNKLVNKYSKGFRKSLFKNKLVQYTTSLKNLIDNLDNIENKIKDTNNHINNLESENIRLKKLQLECKNQFAFILNKVIQQTLFWPHLNKIITNISIDNFETIFKTFTCEIEKGKNSLEDRKKRYIDITPFSEDELLRKLNSLSEEKETKTLQRDNALKSTASSRMSHANVIAATIDACISRIPPDDSFKPSHIFLDEAGYCSLIKGMTLLSYHCPLTMLGDHMQLPPICEMNDDKFSGENELGAMYAQSALYAEDYNLQPTELVKRYLKNENPTFDIIHKFNLNHTFRFGSKLAKILADNVYTPSFHGSNDTPTEIYYINSPKLDSPKPRYSSTEVDNIVKYVHKIKEQNITYGIITPYRVQRKELINAFFGKEEVLTIHGSQGREWNTVILSVVDTTQRWFTDSNNSKSNGLKVINTAVSRAKQKLVIVCDAKYWKAQQDQLIGKLIAIGHEIKL